MEFTFTDNTITFEKEISPLDQLALSFVQILDKHQVKYVLISGYVAILFGRSRSSEDIVMFIEKMPYEQFLAVWNDLQKGLPCITTSDAKDAYEEYLTDGLALRFSAPSTYIPNMEVKFPKRELDETGLKQRVRVVVNGQNLYISPIEMQIPFKIFLGSDKDLEDARHLYGIFKKYLNMATVHETMRKLEIPPIRIEELG